MDSAPAHDEPSSPSFLAENTCGDYLTRPLRPSQESLNVNLIISHYGDVGARAVRVCQRKGPRTS